MELFYDLKKKDNAENLSDYYFALNIVKSSNLPHDDFVEYLKRYSIIEANKDEDNYIEDLLSYTFYDDVNVEVLNNPEYIYGLWQQEQNNDYEERDYSFFDFIPPKLRNNKEFWIKMSKEGINVLGYVSDELKRNQEFILELESHQDNLYYCIDDKEFKEEDNDLPFE